MAWWTERKWLGFMALLAIVGCKRSDASALAGAAPSAAGAPAPPELRPKMNGYIEHCLNAFTDNVHESESHYYSWAPKAQPPSEKTKELGALSSYIDPKSCLDAVTKLNEMQPKDAALEEAATRYADALMALRPVLDDARRYYKARGYKTDKFAKARQLHATLVNCYEEFDAANQALEARIDALQDQEDARDLARLEKNEGRKLPFLVRATYMRSKAVTRVANNLGTADYSAQFSSASADVDAIVKELLAYRDAHGEEAHRLGVQDYTQEAEKFARAARDLRQKLEDKQPASPEQLEGRYNSLVASLNELRL